MSFNSIHFLRTHSVLLFFLSFFVFATACEKNTVCTTENGSLVKVAFKRIARISQGDTLFMVNVVTEDNVLISWPDTTLTNTILPLNPEANTSTFYFFRKDRVDTLTLAYKTEQLLISPECGFDQRYAELSVAATSFDSTLVLKSKVDTDNSVNIDVYSCLNQNIAEIKADFFKLSAKRQKIDTAFFYNSVYDDQGKILYTNDTLSSVRLPVQAGKEQARYFFQKTVEGIPVVDTLTFRYIERMEQIARVCAPQILYDTLQLVHTSLDSIAIINRDLRSYHDLNVEIFP